MSQAPGPLEADCRRLIEDVLNIEILEAQLRDDPDLDAREAARLFLNLAEALSQGVFLLAQRLDELDT